MTVITRIATSPAQPRHKLLNPVYAAGGPFALLRNGRTFLRASGRTLQTCTDWADTVAAGGTPLWTSTITFPEDSYYTLTWVHELANGELLACLTNTTNSPPSSHLRRSTGWPINPATATWAQVLASQGGRFDQEYSSHQWASGTNGVVVIAESGAQTGGGSANDTADNARAVRAYMSSDFGATFAPLFNLRDFATAQGVPYPAGVHLHGIAYDEAWDRIWINYGDDTGDGTKIAGTGNAQVAFSDDRGTTWSKLAVPANWAGTTAGRGYGQFIAAGFSAGGMILTPDVSKPIGALLYRRTGYRQLGAAQWLVPAYGLNGRLSNAGGLWVATGVSSGAFGAGTYTRNVAVSGDGLAWDLMAYTQTLTSSAPIGTVYALGPTPSGRLVLALSGGSANAGGSNFLVGAVTAST